MSVNHSLNGDRPVGSPRSREISEFAEALVHRSRNATGAGASSDLLAWKTSLLELIAADSGDPEVHEVAEDARTQLDQARDDASGSGGGR